MYQAVTGLVFKKTVSSEDVLMKTGLGLYRHMLTNENFRFARQVGATHIIAHMTDYFKQAPTIPSASEAGWGAAGKTDELWSLEELVALREAVQAEGLVLEAIENFDPSHWYDILLAGPRRNEQIENLKELIRRVGQAGIPIFGYNFSIAGVWGHVRGPWARGGAETVAFLGPDGPEETPIPNGMVWNMIYDPNAPPGTIGAVTSEQLWERLEYFLNEMLPVAEEAGVRLAAHPDDPPMPAIRQTARLVYQPHLYQKLIDLNPSPANALEFCVGTVAEMSGGDVYQAVDAYSRQNRLAYVHLRNVKGKVPRYYEVFIDEGDTDMIRVLSILKNNNYQGVIIPDHTPSLECAAPWHAGMAYAIGYIRAVSTLLERQ
jgi:mannonate dehydratase